MNKRSAEESVEKGDEKASRSPSRKKLHTRNKGDEEETAQRIWMNPDALSIECGICFMPFEAEVFMVSTNNKLLSIPTAILCRLMIPLFFSLLSRYCF